MNASREFEILCTSNPPSLQDVDRIGEMLKAAFPPSELGEMGHPRPKDIAGIEGFAEASCTNNTLVLRNDEGEICALMMFSTLPSFDYVSYFTVDESMRNLGLGGEMLDYVVGRFEGGRGCECEACEESASCTRPIVLEVEMPTTDIARRRIGFYKRHGFCENGYAYIVPDLSDGSKEVQMILMSHGRPLEEGEFDRAYKELLLLAYGVES